jgi:hypothetical protein
MLGSLWQSWSRRRRRSATLMKSCLHRERMILVQEVGGRVMAMLVTKLGYLMTMSSA